MKVESQDFEGCDTVIVLSEAESYSKKLAEISFDLVVEPRNAEEYLSLPWDNVKVKLMGGEKVWNCSLQL